MFHNILSKDECKQPLLIGVCEDNRKVYQVTSLSLISEDFSVNEEWNWQVYNIPLDKNVSLHKNIEPWK